MNVTNLLMKTDLVDQTFLGNKWMTRREVKGMPPAPDDQSAYFDAYNGGPHWNWWLDDNRLVLPQIKCPYGQPGDLVYIKETFWAFGRWETRYSEKKGRDEWHFVDMTYLIESGYQFEEPGLVGKRGDVVPAWHKRPSIFMPRRASRLTLRIKAVRVERLQDIGEEDAEAEGCNLEWYADNAGSEGLWPCPDCDGYGLHGALGPNLGVMEVDCTTCNTARKMFECLWQSINGPESWEANPWVWVIEYEPIFENVDAVLAREAA